MAHKMTGHKVYGEKRSDLFGGDAWFATIRCPEDGLPYRAFFTWDGGGFAGDCECGAVVDLPKVKVS